MESEKFGYFSKIVADKINIGKDTLRTWSIKLESEGIEFDRNDRKQRIYYEKDIRMLKNMKELMDLQQPLNDTAKIIAEKAKKGDYINAEMEKNEEKTLSVFDGKNELILQEKRINEFHEILVQKFEKIQDDRFEQFKNELVLDIAEAMQNKFDQTVDEAVKKALIGEREALAKAIASELAANQEKPEKKSFWKRIFK